MNLKTSGQLKKKIKMRQIHFMRHAEWANRETERRLVVKLRGRVLGGPGSDF